MTSPKADAEASMDPHDLCRFLSAQLECYPDALAELSKGRKRTHWMWFVFPQFEGLGSSETSHFYAIKSRAEAKEYLGHSVLGARLLACTGVLLRLRDRSARQIMGSPDDLKLRSSMTLFAAVAENPTPFEGVLTKYFDGKKDTRTLELLGAAERAH